MNVLGHVVQARSAVGVQKRQRSAWAEGIRTGFRESRARGQGLKIQMCCKEGGREEEGNSVSGDGSMPG